MGVSDSHLRIINDELVLDEVLKVSDNAVKENAFEAAAAADSEITPPEQFQNSFHQNEHTGNIPYRRIYCTSLDYYATFGQI